MAVIVKLGADISEVEKKAEEIPGAVDRAMRKGRSRKPWEGTGAEGSRSDYGKLANVSKEQERAAEQHAKNEAQRKEKDRKESNADYLRRLKFNSKVLEDQNRAAAREERERQRKEEKMANAKDWSDQFVDIVGKGLLRTVGPWAAAIKAFQVATEAIKAAWERIGNVGQVSSVTGMTPQKLIDIQTAARKVGANPDEISGMVSGLQEKLYKGTQGDPQGITAIALLKGIGMNISEAGIRSGAIDAADAIKFLSDKYGDMEGNVEGAMIMTQLFGAEYTKLIPLLRQGSKEIKESGGSFDASQTQVQSQRNMKRGLGNIWESITNWWGNTVYGYAEDHSRALMNDYKDFIEENMQLNSEQQSKKLFTLRKDSFRNGLPVNTGGLMEPGESSVEFKRRMEEMFKFAKSHPRGDEEFYNLYHGMFQSYASPMQRGTKGAPTASTSLAPKDGAIMSVPSLAIASSLQAMGGGDFASAISRGPVDRIADSTAETASNTAAIAERVANTGWTPPAPSAVLGK